MEPIQAPTMQLNSSFILQILDKSNPRISIINVKEAKEANSRGESFQPLTVPFPTVSSVRLQNCCDGILCASFLKSDRILLWNPMTKWTKEIGYPYECDDARKDIVGFGYDSSIKDYKVVRISAMHYEVFNLKSNAWRSVFNVFRGPGRLFSGSPPVYLNGNLYWKIKYKKSERLISEDLIIRFDLAKERLSLVQKPKEDMEFSCFCELKSFRGMLCLMHMSFETDAEGSEIWVLKDENKWIKVMKIDPPWYIPMCCVHEDFIFRRIVDGRAPFIVSDTEKGQNYTNINISEIYDHDNINVFPRGIEYVASLISPPSFSDHK